MPRLRLTNHRQSVVFEASSHNLRSQLNQAFLKFSEQAPSRCACLEVEHRIFGWNQVCYEGRYPLISCPLTLNYPLLWLGVLQTLKNCDTWPTEEERARQRREWQIKERRNQFFLVTGSKEQ